MGGPRARRWPPTFAVLKAAGAVGLALGLLGVRLLGIAAAVGLVQFFLCAVIRHVQTRVHHNMAFPGTFLALSVASLALALAR
ncbi:DoxX family protein [Streptomyces sp. WM6378]|uniref:DoxX family protein n=1 Tax=Streptomyces sp. WM6378 TaxID=1415557 RepID=UPI00099D923A|nr:DoxX family protein [Streptomyces sp. WM6378]